MKGFCALPNFVRYQPRTFPMTKSYPDITRRISGNLKTLRKNIPDTMQGFSALAAAATKEGVLDKKTKELIALAIGVATRCDGCIGFHAEALVRLGATRQEVEETLGMAIYMGGGPSLMYASDAIMAFEQFSAPQAS
jgi:AhpD family alkylhydroperoxidase